MMSVRGTRTRKGLTTCGAAQPWVEVNIQAKLEAMIGEGPQFQGVQEAAIKAIMAGKSPILVVIGTGGGKTLVSV